MFTSSVFAHPRINPIKDRDIEALETMARERLTEKDLSKFLQALTELKESPKTKASFGTLNTPPSHELMTNESFGEARSGNKHTKSKWQLINGAIWNDDPTGLIGWRDSLFDDSIPGLWGVSFLYSELETYLGIPLDQNDFLGRSHFGDLQFLHAMSDKSGMAPEITKSKIMAWCKYAYLVAVESIPLASKTSANFKILTIKKGQTTGDLFNNHEPLFALGTIAHLIQDSFSQAHVSRDDKYDIMAFLVYPDQSKSGHKVLDRKGVYEKTGGWDQAVEHVQQIFDFAFNKAKWCDVEKYLSEKVFRLSDNAKPSWGGGI